MTKHVCLRCLVGSSVWLQKLQLSFDGQWFNHVLHRMSLYYLCIIMTNSKSDSREVTTTSICVNV